MNNCKYETSNGRCGLKGSYAYRHKCFTEDLCKRHEPKTNSDLIRSMSDEELVECISKRAVDRLCEIVCGGECKALATLDKTCDQVCKEIVLNWLQTPADHTEVASDILMRPNGEEDA